MYHLLTTASAKSIFYSNKFNKKNLINPNLYFGLLIISGHEVAAPLAPLSRALGDGQRPYYCMPRFFLKSAYKMFKLTRKTSNIMMGPGQFNIIIKYESV